MLELTDHAFTGVQPLLPANSRRGKPWRDHRQVLGRILLKLHTARPWRDVPERFGPWQTCYSRLRRWQADGTWPRIWGLLAAGDHDSPNDHRGEASQATLPAAPGAAAGAGLMAAPPPRPPQHLPHAGWRPPHQPDQQPAHLRGRDPDQVRAGWLWQFCALSRPPRPPDRPGRGPPPGTPGRPSPSWRAHPTAARTGLPSPRPRPARSASTRSVPAVTKPATYPTQSAAAVLGHTCRHDRLDRSHHHDRTPVQHHTACRITVEWRRIAGFSYRHIRSQVGHDVGGLK